MADAVAGDAVEVSAATRKARGRGVSTGKRPMTARGTARATTCARRRDAD